MRIALFALTMLVTLASYGQNPAFPSAWKHYQPVRLNATGLVKIALAPELPNASKAGLEDLRLLNEKMQEIPFVVENPRKPSARTINVKHLASRVEGKETILEIETGVSEPIRALHLETPSQEFFKPLTITGSADGANWQTLAENQTIYKSESSTKKWVELTPGTWRLLRVRIDDSRTAPIPFERAWVATPLEEMHPTRAIEAEIFQRQEGRGETRLRIRIPANVFLARVEFQTAEPFYNREVTLLAPRIHLMDVVEGTVASGQISRVRLEDGSVRDLSYLEVESPVPASELTLVIRNGDSPALPVEKIRIHHRPYQLAFHNSQAGTVYLATGNWQAARPRYDIGVNPRTLEKTSATAAELGPVQPNPNYKEPEALPGVAEVGAAIDLGDWKYRKQIVIARPGVQELELDPETRSLFGESRELRIVQDDKQLPFLVKGTTGEREISVSLTPEQDPERPTVSIWTIKLAYGNLPVRRLECVVATPVFQRSVTLLEPMNALRGQVTPRVLALETWARKPEDTKAAYSLDLSGRPELDTLRLEVENRDNPPLKIERAQVFVPVIKLVFKAKGERPIYLYFGNPSAHEPAYDLAIAGKELLYADRREASLGKVEELKGGRGTSWLGAKGTPVFFWAVLLVVVAALFFVISRLLPAKAE